MKYHVKYRKDWNKFFLYDAIRHRTIRTFKNHEQVVHGMAYNLNNSLATYDEIMISRKMMNDASFRDMYFNRIGDIVCKQKGLPMRDELEAKI